MKIAYEFVDEGHYSSCVSFVINERAYRVSCPDHEFEEQEDVSDLLRPLQPGIIHSIYANGNGLLLFDSFKQYLEYFRALYPGNRRFYNPSIWLKEYGHHGDYLEAALNKRGLSLHV